MVNEYKATLVNIIKLSENQKPNIASHTILISDDIQNYNFEKEIKTAELYDQKYRLIVSVTGKIRFKSNYSKLAVALDIAEKYFGAVKTTNTGSFVKIENGNEQFMIQAFLLEFYSKSKEIN